MTESIQSQIFYLHSLASAQWVEMPQGEAALVETVLLVSCCCYNRLPQTQWLKNVSSITDLEVRNLKGVL